MYRFEYSLSKEDYFNYNMHFYKTSRTNRNTLNIARIFIFLSITLLTIVMRVNDHIDTGFVIFLIVFLSIIVLFFPKIVFFVARIKIDKMLNEGSPGEMFSKKIASFSDSEIEVFSEHSKTNVTWSGITRFEENQHYLFLFLDRVKAIVLPKRLFNTTIELDEFRKLCLKKIK